MTLHRHPSSFACPVSRSTRRASDAVFSSTRSVVAMSATLSGQGDAVSSDIRGQSVLTTLGLIMIDGTTSHCCNARAYVKPQV